jgi:type IV secretory pathway ATPase VirB11/archaellum biosynthesis ATPase
MFVRHDGEVYWRKSRATALKNYKIGININDMKHISSLVEIKDINALNAEYASSISQLRISTISESDHVTGIINMAYGDIKPYFSKDMLLYIKENYRRLTIDDTIWIPMDEFDIDLPIFGSIIANDSMIHFVKSVVSFLENKEKLSSYTSIPEALRDFSTVVYNKVVANILHLEVMLRAYMVTSPFDFSIPIVTDINNVRFESNQVLNTERSLGTFLAFERFSSVIKSPSAYVIPKCTDPFDIYVGFDFLDN